MLYSDTDIFKAIESGQLEVKPLRGEQVQPASIDLHLAHTIMIRKDKTKPLNPQKRDDGGWYEVSMHTESLLLPGELILASTLEWVKFGNQTAGVLEGLSSLGRIGLNTCSACGLIDPGFEGNITVELWSGTDAPVYIRPGMRICQLMVYGLVSPVTRMYNGKYQGHKSATTASPD